MRCDMGFSDIQDTPAQISLFFVNVDATPPPFPHPLGGVAGTIIRAILLSQLPQSAQDALNQLLSTPLDQVFDQAWNELHGTAQGMVLQAVQSAVPNAYSINASLPPKGALRASVGGLAPGMLDSLPPGTTGMQLTLSYFLSGFSVSFRETTSGIFGAWADPSYNLTFDGEIEINIAVPSESFIPIGAKAEFLTHNMQAGAGNFFALLIGLEDLISEWLNDQPIGSTGSSLQDQITAINIPALQELFTELSSGFAVAAKFGFIQLAPQINTNPPAGTPPGNTVEFDLTHPFDPGPVVTNAASAGGPSFFRPLIGTSVPQVHAGDPIGVTGTFFPPAQASQLTITWTDTTSGTVAQSEIQWGIAPNGQVPPPQPADVKIVRHGPFDNANVFTAKGLLPNTPYAFRVRDFDVADFIATDWSAWAVFVTTASDQVQLLLNDANNTLLGNATVQGDGAFSTTVSIPANVAPGTYLLTALMSGQQMAQTIITVVAGGQALPPTLQVIDPITGIPFQAGIVVIGQFTVRGANFNPGTVNFFIDTAGGTSLGVTLADANGGFTTNLIWPVGQAGPHKVVAQQGALEATFAVFAEDPPR
jgi:hypothetical protein